MTYDLDGVIYKQDYLYLPSAQHYSEVFKMDQINLAKEQKKEAKEFVKKITLIQNNNWAHTVLDDRLSALRTFGEKKNVEKEVIDVAVEELRLANLDLKSEEE